MKDRLRPYLQAIPDILSYQIVTKLMLTFSMLVLGWVFSFLLKSTGRVAITSGDWKFLFATWPGVFMLILIIAVLFMYVAVDINGKIVLSDRLVKGMDISLRECITEGFNSTGKIFNPKGALVVLYIVLIAPVLGFGFSISLTKGLYIPTFITSFIQDSVLYSGLSGIAVLLLLSVGVANLFILHGTVIDGLSVSEASGQSRRLLKANWKDYLKKNFLFILALFAAVTLNAAVVIALPLWLIHIITMPAALQRFLVILFVTAGVVIYLLVAALMVPFYLMKMTQLYLSYRQGSEFEYSDTDKENWYNDRRIAAACAAVFIAAVVAVFMNFDRWFPADSQVGIIAHRAGGVEAPENTLKGIETACNAGAYGCEIDIQRTSDGYYVLNHDGTFRRTAGSDKKPEEMSLAEIKELSVDGEPVAEFEETLQAAKGRLVLFTELKGNTADRQMADDAVSLIKNYGMEDECVLISLKYDLIDYIESEYPEIQTGFLAFASFGNTAGLNCDYIGLEEESATAYTIASIHGEGKRALVWTVNGKGEQRYFFSTDVDCIITDNITQASEIRAGMPARTDFERMADKIKIYITSSI